MHNWPLFNKQPYITMYHRYFGLKEAPFSIAVNPRYLYMSARHRDALAHLIYGVGVGSGAGGGGFILLTGEVGTGKTTINRCLLEQLPENTDIALILNPALNAVELLATVCDELSIDYAAGEQSLKVLTDKLHHFLLENHAKGRNTVLLIDEAQHLQFEVLEQIRLLTNLETNTKKLLQIILVGQPELRDLLNKPELRQLAQRITARYQLKPLNVAETQDYIRHRLHVAGLPANQELFPLSVVKGIHKVSRGVPRIINVLCDRMLLGTYGQNKTVVDKAMLKQAIVEVMGDEDDIELQQLNGMVPFSASMAFILLAAFAWWYWPTSPAMTSDTAASTSVTPAVISQTEQPQPPMPVATAVARPTDLPAPQTATPQTSAVDTVTASTINNIPVEPWTTQPSEALSALVTTSGFTNDPNVECLDSRLRCEPANAKSWQELISFNRPAVLELLTPGKMQTYAALVAIKGDRAQLSFNGEIETMSLENLGKLWTGNFTFIWQAPQDYDEPLSLNDEGEAVNWIARQFAELDKQPSPLAKDIFNMPLTQRVKIFQTNHNLDADGVVGLKTLLKLNEVIGTAQTLDDVQMVTPTQASITEGS